MKTTCLAHLVALRGVLRARSFCACARAVLHLATITLLVPFGVDVDVVPAFTCANVAVRSEWPQKSDGRVASMA